MNALVVASGSKRLVEANIWQENIGICQKGIGINFLEFLPEEISVEILSKLDQNVLQLFECVKSDASGYTEKIWENRRQRDYLNFSWASIPIGLGHHKWSYLLNDAIMICLDKIDIIGFTKRREDYPKRFSVNSSCQIFSTYGFSYLTHAENAVRLDELIKLDNPFYVKRKFNCLLEKFSEFRYFFNAILCGKNIENKDRDNKEVLGGDLALKALSCEIFTKIVDADCDSHLPIITSYLNAIEKNATFLANRWIYRDDLYLDGMFREEFRENEIDSLTKYINLDSTISSKPLDENELIAIKAAEKKDYRAIIKLLSKQTGIFIWSLIERGIKLPSWVWLEAARQNGEFHKDILLLYTKAFEVYEKKIPDTLWEEAVNTILEMKCELEKESHDNYDATHWHNGEYYGEEYSPSIGIYEIIWDEATESLRVIKQALESRMAIKGSAIKL